LARIFFTVTNDLVYDQRMHRICNSLALAGFDVHLIGRKKKKSPPLTTKHFTQHRIPCLFTKGFLFYAEFNIRLFFYLLFKKMDGICAIDLDSIMPVYMISKVRKKKRIFDAHELFCEMKEVVSRPRIYKIWKTIERYFVPKFKYAYTVNPMLASTFNSMYSVNFEVIRSISVLKNETLPTKSDFILYQGAVNEGRCFEDLIPAMQNVDARLIVCGEGNFMEQAKRMVVDNQLQDKITFEGMVAPETLSQFTLKAKIGITLFEADSKNNYLSLANRYFDYIHAGTPQLCMNYPAYAELNQMHQVAVLIDDHRPDTIAKELNHLLQDTNLWGRLHKKCLEARSVLCWQEEEKKLIKFYRNIFE